jgi:hypothetical protein
MECQWCIDLQSAWAQADAAHFKALEALGAARCAADDAAETERKTKLARTHAEFALGHHRRNAHQEPGNQSSLKTSA